MKKYLLILLLFITLKNGEVRTYDEAFTVVDEGIVWVLDEDYNAKELVIDTFPEYEVSHIAQVNINRTVS